MMDGWLEKSYPLYSDKAYTLTVYDILRLVATSPLFSKCARAKTSTSDTSCRRTITHDLRSLGEVVDDICNTKDADNCDSYQLQELCSRQFLLQNTAQRLPLPTHVPASILD